MIGKRGQVPTKATTFVFIILGIIVVFAIASEVVPVAQSAGDQLGEGGACSDAGCAFDNPAGFCAINSSSEGASIACPNSLRASIPLGVLFASGGVVFILIAVFLLNMVLRGKKL